MGTPLTYISLFSSAGVGCYGFKMEGFKCIATNELIARRLAVQRANGKCEFDSGYISGDITQPDVKKRLFDEIDMWRERELLSEVDVVIATPPCQGMSVANHKKNEHEIVRNSLVVQSIGIIAAIQPKVFVFENVPLFMRTPCTDTDGSERTIAESIERNLGALYSMYSQVLNFKDYGACSSRTRTLVIGVRRDYADFFSPLELFPTCKPELTLHRCIGHMKRLRGWGEIDDDDIYHSFRVYPEHMRAWICDLREGESAFDNADTSRVPHRVIDGVMVLNTRKNNDKYRRQPWDKVGPCVHTRNDQLASQNTIHPEDDRVFSIRELMMMMTIPDSFRWADVSPEQLNHLSAAQKREFLRKHEINIRQSLGEAVPTEIFRSIAANIKTMLGKVFLKDADVRAEIAVEQLTDVRRLVDYIRANPRNLGFASLCRIAELANSKRNEQEAYFTNKSLINEIVKTLPPLGGDHVRVLEPSVGAGNFLPFVIKLFEHKSSIQITAVDVDSNTLDVLRELVNHIPMSDKVTIDYICNDFLLDTSLGQYDLVIGNPPFSKSTKGEPLERYRSKAINKRATNTSAFFFEKALTAGSYVAMVMPKVLLNTAEFAATRDLLASKRIDTIVDFGESGFDGVLIETVALCVNPHARPAATTVISITEHEQRTLPQKYICDTRFPYWLIYRNTSFDSVCDRLQFDVFTVFRDRQLTNSLMNNCTSGIRVLKSRNISDDGTQVIDIKGYDAYIDADTAARLLVYRFFDNDSVYLTPNMTYKPRVMRKPKGVLVNGSAAILKLKDGQPPLSEAELRFFSSAEYREFYRTARNRQTRSLNVDSNSVFFFGRLKTEEENP